MASMIRSGWLLALTLSAWLPAAASAATLSLSDCVKLAQSRSVQAVQAAIDEQQAKAARAEADSARLPQVFASGQLLRSDDASTNLPDDNNATINLEQRLWPFSPGWARARQRNALYQAAVLGKLETAQDVALSVKKLYFAILEDEDAVRSSDQVEAQLRRLLDTVVPKFTIGRAPAFDPVKVRVSLADLARARGLLEARLAEEKQTLALVIGAQDPSTLDLTPLSGQPALPLPGFSDVVLAADPTLATLRQKADAARLGVGAAQALRYPDVVGHLDYNYAAQATSQMTPGWTAAVALRVPVFDWGGISDQIRQERLSVRAAENGLEAARQTAMSSVTRAFNEAQAHRQDDRTLTDLLPRVHEVAVASVSRYRRGASSILEATDAVNLWLSTLLNERAAYYDYLANVAELERLSGGRFQAAYEK